ncbi:MAG: ribosomal protein S18-alanine N-acetyltransferase [Oscillospiraceae bacterium]|nr:ribosomal protein S18-alanine N-acetyltransferase [Oscillospiraceae bacterium]
MAVTIRLASPADIPELVRLEQACFSLPHTEEQFRHELQDDVYALFTASDGNVILGYAGLTHILDEGYITNVAVFEQARRQGIADRLLAALDDFAAASALSFISLEVRQSNTPALSLYAKNGYRKTGEIPNYYTNPKENALIMTKYYSA